MKSVKLFVTLVTVLLFCTALTVCAEENNEQPKQDAVQVEVEQKERVQLPEGGDDGGQAEREREVREAEERAEEEDRLVPREGDDGGQAEREREAREAEERAEQEHQRQEEEARQREEEEHQQQQQTGNYEHHIGDAVFYTQHDIWEYIFPNPVNPAHNKISIRAMLADVWNVEGIYDAKDSYAGTDGSSFNCAVSFGYVDGKSGSYFTVSRTGERQYSTIVIAHNEQTPPGGFLIVDGESSGFGFTPDMAALLLYVLDPPKSAPIIPKRGRDVRGAQRLSQARSLSAPSASVTRGT